LADLFRQGLESGAFQVVARLTPPRSPDFSDAVGLASSWEGKVGTILVADNPSAVLGGSSLLLADRLKREGKDVALTISCRDLNRLALGSIALGAAAASIETILCVSGDYPTFGDHPQAKPVYDLDSVQLLGMLRDMEMGRDIAGNSLDDLPAFFPGAAVAVTADPLGPQLMKVKRKLAAGARFLISLPVFSKDPLDRFRESMKDTEVKILAGILLPSFDEIARYHDGSIPGTFIPEDLVDRWRGEGEEKFRSSSVRHIKNLVAELRESGRVDGVCISASGRESEIGDLL
jgi:methylenetetrahydrofolate reductase (NADPH)